MSDDAGFVDSDFSFREEMKRDSQKVDMMEEARGDFVSLSSSRDYCALNYSTSFFFR